MHKHLLIAVALVAGTSVAQNNLSDFLNTGVTFTSRNGANFVPATIYTRLDSDRYAGWGVDPAMPGTRRFTGLHFFIQDQLDTTQDTFQLTAFTESATPSVPDTAAPLATTGNFVLPLGTGGVPVAYNANANFATPINAPGVDVFVAISTTLGWTNPITDGLSIWATSSAPASVLRDEPGFSAPIATPGNTYSGHYIPSTLVHGFGAQRHSWIEPIISTPAGLCTALHYGDPVHANANTSPGTACFMSGQFPDAQSPPRIAGRADDIGLVFRHTGIPDGTPVFFLVDIAPGFGPEIPLSTFIAGSTGVACLNLVSTQTMALGFTLGGQASNVLVLPAPARTFIAGLRLNHQAAAFDPVLGVALSGPCSGQTL
jgi:hypothetical protein